MADLQAQNKYKTDAVDYGKVMRAMTNNAIRTSQAAKKYRSKKAVDVSKYTPVANSIKKIGVVTTPYGGSTKYEKFHPGIDIANKIGTPLYSTTGGKVSQVVSGKKQGDPGYGNYVEVVDAKGNRHRYSHLANSYVNVGDIVKQGQIYGTMGNTGSTYSTSGGTGSHLDYRIWDMYNKYVNPMNYLI